MYSCSTCKKEIKVTASGEIQRTCNHTSKVVMELECTLYGEGQAEHDSNPLVEFFRAIGARVINRYQDAKRKKS